jgi:hypothetical protein
MNSMIRLRIGSSVELTVTHNRVMITVHCKAWKSIRVRGGCVSWASRCGCRSPFSFIEKGVECPMDKSRRRSIIERRSIPDRI